MSTQSIDFISRLLKRHLLCTYINGCVFSKSFSQIQTLSLDAMCLWSRHTCQEQAYLISIYEEICSQHLRCDVIVTVVKSVFDKNLNAARRGFPTIRFITQRLASKAQ